MMRRSILVAAIVLCCSMLFANQVQAAGNTLPWWNIQSIDTMKYSRDLAEVKLQDSSFDKVIDQQVSQIAATGATHISIDTPYDERFIPFLTRWVKAARKYNLHVWFRGNFSGWEGWFGFQKIDRSTHVSMTRQFIMTHPDLFEDGDIFSACPECENGGSGDPRVTKDVSGYRSFLVDLYQTSRDAFLKIGKNVQSNLHSMNGDVARLIMDKETTKALGGIVTIDHYVATKEQFVKDIREIAKNSQGKIVLGEFGAPIPDIHGNLNDSQQAKWVDDTLAELEKLPEVVGINYWVNLGGSTALWKDDGIAKPVVEVVRKYFVPDIYEGKIVDSYGEPVKGAAVKTSTRETKTGIDGTFKIAHITGDVQLTIQTMEIPSITIVATDRHALELIQLKTPRSFIADVVHLLRLAIKHLFR